jgi:DNA-binding NtrC family response regulator
MLNAIDGHRVSASAPSVPDAPATSPRTILIVTSDENLSAAAFRVLHQEGYDVLIARHAGHAFLAALTQARIDVLISELTLDDMSGEALAATLRRHHPALRTVFITDHTARPSIATLVRPFTRDELLDELSALAIATTSQAS